MDKITVAHIQDLMNSAFRKGEVMGFKRAKERSESLLKAYRSKTEKLSSELDSLREQSEKDQRTIRRWRKKLRKAGIKP